MSYDDAWLFAASDTAFSMFCLILARCLTVLACSRMGDVALSARSWH
jgi:hypothetical protein